MINQSKLQSMLRRKLNCIEPGKCYNKSDKAFMISNNKYLNFNYFRFCTLFTWRNIILVLILLQPGFAKSQSDEEIIVSVNVKRIGSIELPAIIHNEKAYLPIKQ